MQAIPENNDMLLTAINAKIEPIVRQLERMEERMENRTRDLATRSDLEVLRKELVTRDAFEPQLQALKTEMAHIKDEGQKGAEAIEKRIDDIEKDQISRQDRLWIRVGQITSFTAFAIAMLELMTHLKWLP